MEKPIDQVKDLSAKNSQWAINNYQVMEKTLKNNHNSITRQLLKRHQELVDVHMDKWKAESKKALSEMAKVLKETKKES